MSTDISPQIWNSHEQWAFAVRGRIAILVIPTCQANLRVIVAPEGADVDHSQGLSVPDKIQAVLLAEASVSDHRFDFEPGKACLEIGQVVWEEFRVTSLRA